MLVAETESVIDWPAAIVWLAGGMPITGTGDTARMRLEYWPALLAIRRWPAINNEPSSPMTTSEGGSSRPAMLKLGSTAPLDDSRARYRVFAAPFTLLNEPRTMIRPSSWSSNFDTGALGPL